MEVPFTPGLSHIAYRLPGSPRPLAALARQERLASAPDFLADIGFGTCFVADAPGEVGALALDCGEAVLAARPAGRSGVGWLLWYSGLDAAPEAQEKNNILDRFRYPAARALDRLGLPGACGMGVAQQGCSGLLSSIHLACSLLHTGAAEAVLCLASDALPAGAPREVLYNVMSDAAGAVVVEKHAAKNRILHFRQHAMPYLWDTPRHTHEVLAAYFPLAQRTILGTLEQAGRSVEEVAWFVPHNVSARSWNVLADLLGVCPGRVWMDNIGRVGHTVSCDHLINLHDMEAAGALRKGDLLVLFTFGFGASWTCMLLEH